MRLLITILLIPAFCYSQPLTRIKNKEQVEKFITKKFKFYGYRYDSFLVDSGNSNYDNFKVGDFNYDGIKDLLVFGTAIVTPKSTTFREDEIVIIIGDKKRPRKVSFPYGYFRGLGIHWIPYPKVISVGQKDFIIINYDIIDRSQRSQSYYDTLFIINDHVVPFVESPSYKEVSRIEFRTDHCYGTCPVFEMTLHKNLDVEYNGIDYVDNKGEFKLKMERKDWDYLTNLIAYLKLEYLSSNYDIGATDHQTAFLTVVYSDGETKSIEDYGLSGTFGLTVLYDYLFELRKF